MGLFKNEMKYVCIQNSADIQEELSKHQAVLPCAFVFIH